MVKISWSCIPTVLFSGLTYFTKELSKLKDAYLYSDSLIFANSCSYLESSQYDVLRNMPLSLTAALSRIAYFKNETALMTWNCGKTCAFVPLAAPAIPISSDTSFGIVVQPQQYKNVVAIAFRGTVNTVDAFYDIIMIMTPVPECQALGAQFKNAKSHLGFYGVYKHLVEGGLWDAAKIAVKEAKATKIILTGHSLGGAVATVAACAARTMFPEIKDIELVTYNAPRVGNTELSAAISQSTSVWDRIYDVGDVVPHLPLQKDGFVSGGVGMPMQKSRICVSWQHNNADFKNEYFGIMNRALSNLEESHLRFCGTNDYFGTYDLSNDNIAEQPSCQYVMRANK